MRNAITLILFLSLLPELSAQMIFGKHPADTIIPQAWNQNSNLSNLVNAINGSPDKITNVEGNNGKSTWLTSSNGTVMIVSNEVNGVTMYDLSTSTNSGITQVQAITLLQQFAETNFVEWSQILSVPDFALKSDATDIANNIYSNNLANYQTGDQVTNTVNAAIATGNVFTNMASINLGFPHLYKAIFNRTNEIRVIGLGDSTMTKDTGTLLFGINASVAAQFPTTAQSKYWAAGSYYSYDTAGPVTQLGDDTNWFTPYLSIPSGYSVTNDGGYATIPNVNNLQVCAIAQTNGGNLDVYYNTSISSRTLAATLNLQSTTNRGVFTNIAIPSGNYFVSAVSTSGTNLLISASVEQTNSRNWINYDVSYGAHVPLHWLNVDTNIFNPIWRGLNPDLIVFQQKNALAPEVATNLWPMVALFTNACTNADILLTGMFPAPVDTIDARSIALATYDVARQKHLPYFDLYDAFPATNIVDALGYYEPTKVHLSTAGAYWAGSMVWDALAQGMRGGASIVPKIFTNMIAYGAVLNNPVYTLSPDGSAGLIQHVSGATINTYQSYQAGGTTNTDVHMGNFARNGNNNSSMDLTTWGDYRVIPGSGDVAGIGSGGGTMHVLGKLDITGGYITNRNSVWTDRTNNPPPADLNHIWLATDTNAPGKIFVSSNSVWVLTSAGGGGGGLSSVSTSDSSTVTWTGDGTSGSPLTASALINSNTFSGKLDLGQVNGVGSAASQDSSAFDPAGTAGAATNNPSFTRFGSNVLQVLYLTNAPPSATLTNWAMVQFNGTNYLSPLFQLP